jgi:glucosamine--fructose-6-phosphate aminotransferase (isomerizing)
MNPYINDILAQPQALRDTLAALREPPATLTTIATDLQANRFQRIVLTGMGGSFAALVPLWQTLVQAGHAPLLVETSELIYSAPALLGNNTLLIIVSQSGRSAEIVRVLDMANGATVLAITNTAGSPLAQRAHCALVTQAGEESNVSCKTYVCALAALALCGAALGQGDWPAVNAQLEGSVGFVDFYVSQVHGISSLMAEHVTSSSLALCGRGASLAAAMCGGLIIKEAAKFHSEGMGSAAFRHGPLELATTGLCVFVYEGMPDVAPLNARLVRDVNAAGGHGFLIGPNAEDAAFRLPEVPTVALPVIEILPAQMLSVGIAYSKGIEPGMFIVNTKVTATE